ncbi:asparagine synthase-related protein [Nonomuraea sp. NPDC049028]|uniref:asparagine synthase-related protein n=1 Tax=Nonomuraea sp. NPDC049028 TaxID=3364348 RepID=UPI003724847F
MTEIDRLLVVGHCLADRRSIAAALERDDLGALTRLPGSYAWVLARQGELIAYTDLAGQFPLYLSRLGGRTALASHPGVLSDLHERSVDPVTFAVAIACPSVLPLWEHRSPYQGVSRLPGGRLIHVGQSTIRYGTAGPAPDLRAALTEAVATRCSAAPISADFSGGLDSTSLAFLAARHTKVKGIVYHHPDLPTTDLAHASSLAGHGMDLTAVAGDQSTLPYAELTYPLDGEPVRGNLAWRRSLLRLAEAAPMHVTGEGGDALFGAAPSYLAELARPGELRELARHCAHNAALKHASPLGLATRAWRVSRTSPRQALIRLARRLLDPDAGSPTSHGAWRSSRPGAGSLTWLDAVAWWPVDGTVLGWLTRAMRAELAIRLADPALAERVDPDLGPTHVATRAELRQSADAQRQLRELGAVLTGTRVHAPFLDDAVVRACLAVPAHRRVGPTAGKPLLARALRDLVPERVFARRTKGDYSAEEYHGARASAERLHRLIDDSRLAALGVVEPGPVRACLDWLLAGAPAPLGAMAQFVATECWLRGSRPGPC